MDDLVHSVCACGVRMVILAHVLTQSWLNLQHAILCKHINPFCLLRTYLWKKAGGARIASTGRS